MAKEIDDMVNVESECILEELKKIQKKAQKIKDKLGIKPRDK